MKSFLFPGQGSQIKGMGQGLFKRFPDHTEEASQILGYPIEEICLKDPNNQLGQTEFTQPSLFVVNALSYLEIVEKEGKPDYLAGHSLGEYNALFASGAFDFATGLRLVQKRGELMAGVSGGGMAAILGLSAERISEILYNFAFDNIDIANLNSPNQTIISGPSEDLKQSEPIFQDAGATLISLPVSGAFHSRMMRPVQKRFEQILQEAQISTLQIPVIANCTARPYETSAVKRNLAEQITHPVRWVESIGTLIQKGVADFREVGPGNVLSKLVGQIKRQPNVIPS